jgi:hypothetical protein
MGHLADLRAAGPVDVMARRAWDYRHADSYTINSYGKPALAFQTLEGLLGEGTMRAVLNRYARRFGFAHPTTDDLVSTVNEVTGLDYRWFFEETFFSSELCDYAVEVKNPATRALVGYTDGPGPAPLVPSAPATSRPAFEPEVVVKRLGGVRLPVEVLVEFADGTRRREAWDGRDRWRRFRYAAGPRVVRAVVDPEDRLALDVNPANNAWREEAGLARRAAAKWSALFLLWLQDLLELHTVLG